MRGATSALGGVSTLAVFQSTLLMRGATRQTERAEWAEKFQSTLLMRGATKTAEELVALTQISIHAPHARSDVIKNESP